MRFRTFFIAKWKLMTISILLGSLTISWLLNFWYVNGAYWLDAGWYSFSICDSWGDLPSDIKAAYGGDNLMQFHNFSTQIVACKFIQPFTNSLIAFSLLITLSIILIFVIFANYMFGHQDISFFLLILLGFSVLFHPFVLGEITYPHAEIIGTSLAIAAFFVFEVKNMKKIGFLLFICSFMSREDIGLHVAILLVVIILLSKKNRNKIYLKYRWIIASGVLTSFGYFVWSKVTNNPVNLFKALYIGNPPFEILRHPIDMANRIAYWNSTNIWYLICAGLAFYVCKQTKDYMYITPIVSALPWIGLNLLSLDPAKNSLITYHWFPFGIYLCGLFFINQYSGSAIGNLRNVKISFGIFLMVPASINAFSGGPTGTSYATLQFIQRPFINIATIINTNSVIEKIIASDSVSVSLPIASIAPDLITKFNVENAKSYYFMPKYKLDDWRANYVKFSSSYSCIKNTHIALSGENQNSFELIAPKQNGEC